MKSKLGIGFVGCAGLLSLAACQDSLVPSAGTSTGEAATSSGGPTPTTGTTDGPTTTTTQPGTTGDGSSGDTSGAGSTGVPSFLWDVGGGLDLDLPIEDTTTGPVIDWDCNALVQPFESEAELVGPRGYHDVYFDDEGYIYGWDGNSILQVNYEGEIGVFLPGVNSAQGMDVLDNGDMLYVNDFGEVRRVTPDQQVSTVGTGFSGGYGLTVGPDQLAYVCTSSNVRRLDPDSGDNEVWLTLPNGQTPRAIVFNLDSTGAYMSTLLEPGSPVYFVEVDDELNPTGDAVLYANNVGQGYHDGLGIDACGNLYVPDFSTRGLYRIDTDGVVTMLFNTQTSGAQHYGHGLEWGSGVGGWNHKAIYMPQPYDGNTVLEVVLGVPSGSYVRTWVGD
ncbi:MAG: hypothetical protein JNK45_19850 [Myxococcales bacterium]|nr:hypothetical protein [Myxococcales bacterium]